LRISKQAKKEKRDAVFRCSFGRLAVVRFF
jgi:hypothetical protein